MRLKISRKIGMMEELAQAQIHFIVHRDIQGKSCINTPSSFVPEPLVDKGNGNYLERQGWLKKDNVRPLSKNSK